MADIIHNLAHKQGNNIIELRADEERDYSDKMKIIPLKDDTLLLFGP
jgi:hypothetical protein